MADYRLDCSTPGCAYTGFRGHSDFCTHSGRYKSWIQEQDAKRTREENGFKDGVTPDTYICTYCGCLIGDMSLHRENACP